ncbi:MAG: sigma-54 interaction domain-containing protein, partial [Planctomycetota bacterium]
MVGSSSTMQQVYRLIEQVADSNTTVLIRGESGTGKDLVAHAIHYNSPRADKPFVKVNCTALPEALLESELFGHEKGAFTGAIERKLGRFERANGGTIFLDEIGDFPLNLQVKLLRVIQFKEFERLGGYETIKANVRIIVATNKNLEEQIEKALFREDLYYRINVFPIYLPPLRERKDDIMLLADYFLEKLAAANSKDIKRISTPAIEMLTRYHWPGNVRELENCIERAVLLCDGDVIRSEHMPP